MKIVVIGGGPAGIRAALTASHYAEVTLVVEQTIDWKSALPNMWMTHMEEIKKAQSFSLNYFDKKIVEWEQALKQELIESKIRIVEGFAKFVGEKCIEVTRSVNEVNDKVTIEGDKFILATGTRPVFTDKIKPDGKRIFSYQNLHKIPSIPESVIIIGDSLIGYEMVNLFQYVGSNVLWLLPRGRKSSLDSDAEEFFMNYFRERGVQLLVGEWVEELKNVGDRVQALRADGSVVEAEYAFVTLGFVPNLDALQLANLNLSLNQRGTVPVNEFGQTEHPDVYIVGDAQMKMPLSAIRAMATGHIASLHALGQEVEPYNPLITPLVFNENPQYGEVGYRTLDDSMTYSKASYIVGQFRTYQEGDGSGFIKLVYNQQREIVGGVCVGKQAKDVITVVALMIKLKARIEQMDTFFAAHPSAIELPFHVIRKEFRG